MEVAMGKSIFNLILLLTFITYNVNASQGENEKKLYGA